MAHWTCAIGDDGATFDEVEELMIHQATEHERIECRVCGAVVPDGYFAIRHAFDEHSRAEYVRAYDADAADVRRRESIKRRVEDAANIREVVERIDR
jgi:hypothetical protein